MDLQEVINRRHSVRKFKDIDVSDDKIKELVLLAKKSPSAGAIRGYETIITRERIAHVDAPVYLVICTNPEAYSPRYGDRGKNLYSVQDSTIFGAYFQLLLVSEGLASVWVGAFHEERIKKAIGTDLRPVAIIAMGYEQESKG